MRRALPDMGLEAFCQAPVCGVDEAGRGPWAGPVCAAAVILDPDDVIIGLDDSKRLTELRRAGLEPHIKARALAWGIGFASVQEIIALNIVGATGLAMARAVDALQMPPAFALIDGNYAFKLPCPTKTVVKGDAISASIAAASILAKTARDRLMRLMDLAHPGYGFAAHKGYGTALHARTLRELGPCAIHRAGWGPVGAPASFQGCQQGADQAVSGIVGPVFSAASVR